MTSADPAFRIVLLDSFTADQGHETWPGLDELGTVSLHARTSPDELDRVCAGAAAVITNKAVITAALIERLPELRYLGVSATGTNIVDVDAARARGIAVTNVPAYSTDSVAQTTFALILGLVTDVAGHSASVKAGGWAGQPDFAYFLRPLRELAGQTLLVIGRGAIGGAVGRIAAAYGMRVVAAQVPGSPARAAADDRVPLAEALPTADVVSLHCPLTPATRHLVDAAFLAAMRPGAILVNTARGPLVDERAVLDALAAGRLGGFATDVLSVEPPPADHPLTNPHAPWADRVIVTPHIGWGTVEARARLRAEVVANLRAWKRGEARNRIV